MITTLIALIVIGVIGYLIVTYIPMIAPIKIVVTIIFVLIAITYLLKLI